MFNFIVFLGIPGAGKGTQCAMLKAQMNFHHLSPGEIIRATLASNADNEISRLMNSGKLLSDNFIMNLVENNLESVKLNRIDKNMTLIFDGVPRTTDQAILLDELLYNIFEKKVGLVVLLDVKKRIVLKRLKKRVICVTCGIPSQLYADQKFVCSCKSHLFKRRGDDEESVARKRLINDKKTVETLYSFYKKNGIKCIRLSADANKESVFRRVKNEILNSFDIL